jgi:hypothetical protein
MDAATELPLRDIHLPDAISWWPPAPGWWLLAGTLVFILIVALLWRRHWQNQRLLRQLYAELEQLKLSYQADGDAAQTIKQLSILLRRACISYFPRQDVASLTGKDWLALLDSTTKDNAFSRGVGELLVAGPYRPAKSLDKNKVEQLLQLTQRSLKHISSRGRTA